MWRLLLVTAGARHGSTHSAEVAEPSRWRRIVGGILLDLREDAHGIRAAVGEVFEYKVAEACKPKESNYTEGMVGCMEYLVG